MNWYNTGARLHYRADSIHNLQVTQAMLIGNLPDRVEKRESEPEIDSTCGRFHSDDFVDEFARRFQSSEFDGVALNIFLISYGNE